MPSSSPADSLALDEPALALARAVQFDRRERLVLAGAAVCFLLMISALCALIG